MAMSCLLLKPKPKHQQKVRVSTGLRQLKVTQEATETSSTPTGSANEPAEDPKPETLNPKP